MPSGPLGGPRPFSDSELRLWFEPDFPVDNEVEDMARAQGQQQATIGSPSVFVDYEDNTINFYLNQKTHGAAIQLLTGSMEGRLRQEGREGDADNLGYCLVESV